jgi:cell division protein FtsW
MSSATTMSRNTTRGGGLRLDPVLVGIVMAILLLGLVMVTSASMPNAEKASGDPFHFLKAQLELAFGGLCLAALMCVIPTELYQKYASVLVVVAALMLVAVFVPGIGHESHGARRWLLIGGFKLQASEVARVCVLCWIASYAVRREQALHETFAGLLVPLGVTSLFCALLLPEPDLGAATVLFVTSFGLLFLAGARLRWVLVCVLTASAAFGLLAVSADYRIKRVIGFLDPWADPLGSGFQLTQSLIAIGRGEWLGVGLGNSIQKLFYLPEAHTDFIFAVLAEELGLAGMLLTMGLFLALVWRVLHIAREAADAGLKFQAYMAGAFAIWVGVQALVHIGVNTGVLPTKGLTLPFMSYGRSSLLVALAWFGMVLRIHHEVKVRSRGSASGSRREAAGAEA